MKVSLVFLDWYNQDMKSVYNTEEGVSLSLTDFHSGSTFEAKVDLDPEQEHQLRTILEEGYVPIFYIKHKDTKS